MTTPSWPTKSIGDLCVRVTSGGTPSRSNPEYFEPASVPWIKTGDLRDGYITEYDECISEAGVENSSAKLLPANTVLMAMYGATVGMLGMLREPATCNQAACALIVDPELCNPRWIFYALLNSRDFIISQATGAAQQNLSGKTIRNFTFCVPSLPEQNAIAEVLGTLDDKIAANTKLAHTANDLASLTYSAAIESADVVPMSQMLTPILGGTPSRSRDDYWGGSERWISAKDVTGASGQLILDTEEKITNLATENTKAKPLPKGSVILTARGTVGAVARLGEPSSFNQSCYGFVPEDVPASVLYFAVRSASDHAKSMAHGSVFDTITKKTFDHLPMPDLTANEANSLDAVLSPLLAVVESSARENLTLAQIRDSLLPQLMSGKLRIKDAESVIEGAI